MIPGGTSDGGCFFACALKSSGTGGKSSAGNFFQRAAVGDLRNSYSMRLSRQRKISGPACFLPGDFLQSFPGTAFMLFRSLCTLRGRGRMFLISDLKNVGQKGGRPCRFNYARTGIMEYHGCVKASPMPDLQVQFRFFLLFSHFCFFDFYILSGKPELIIFQSENRWVSEGGRNHSGRNHIR